MTEIKASFLDERRLQVTAEPEITVGVLVKALDAVIEKDRNLLFDELVVSRFAMPSPRPP